MLSFLASCSKVYYTV